MNIPTIISIMAVAAALILAARQIIRNRKEGKACTSCPYREDCNRKANQEGCSRVDNITQEW